MQQLFKSVEEKEELFHTELVKYGVEYELAAQVARILVSGTPDELLTDQELKLVKEVCREWLIQRQRYQRLTSLLEELK